MHFGPQDASRLVDVCRQSIIFDSVAGMVSCLELITRDNNVEVIRIKNKMDPAYNSTRSVGYRDVALNLRVISPEAQALGVNAHVCELQLLLLQYAELKVRIYTAFSVNINAFGSPRTAEYALSRIVPLLLPPAP